jgi:hypothetical protein
VFLLAIDGSTCHFLELARPEQESSDLFFSLHRPDPHKIIAIDSKYLILIFHEEDGNYFRLLIRESLLREEAIEIERRFLVIARCDVGL